MSWTHYLVCFFGGAVLANAVPHVVSALQGRAFQSPFAKPPGEGLSSATVNMLWGFANLALAWFLLVRLAHFDLQTTTDVVAAGAGVLLCGLWAAHHFGQFHGGDLRGYTGGSRQTET